MTRGAVALGAWRGAQVLGEGLGEGVDSAGADISNIEAAG